MKMTTNTKIVIAVILIGSVIGLVKENYKDSFGLLVIAMLIVSVWYNETKNKHGNNI